MTLRLEAVEGPTTGQQNTITGITVIGRDPATCGVVIPAQTVSRTHAVVRPDESGPGYVIEDLDSRSGTWVNGVRTRRAVLLEGDRVQIGPALLKVGLREDALSAGAIDPSTLEEPEKGERPRLQTMRLTLDAASFKLRARDLDPSQSSTQAEASGSQKLEPPPAAGPPESPAERLEAIIELSHALAVTHDHTRLVREVCRRLFTLFPLAKRVGYFDVEGAGERPASTPRMLVDRDARAGLTQKSVKISKAIVDEAIAQRHAILSDDLSRDARFADSKSAQELGTRSVLCAPLCAGDRVLGALYLETREGTVPFDEGALRFATGIATVVASAAENARLLAKVQSETARRAVLERYFAPDMLERVLSGEVPLARDGEVRTGTILFTDIRGFTRLTGTTEPKVLVATLNAYFEAMQRIVFRGRGTVERFGGDSILAYWGVLHDDPSGPEHAARAALQMQNELFRLNRELAMAKKPRLDVGIGVNTGDVIAGNVGSAERYEFTILGDAVNLARRIEDLAGPAEVLLGEATQAALRNTALVRLLPPREVKGRAQPVVLAALLGLRADEPGRAAVRWDMALAATLTAPGGAEAEGRVVSLERRGKLVHIEVESGLEATDGKTLEVAVRLPTGARARDRHGLTLELARPIVVTGRFDSRSAVEETSSTMIQRAMNATKAGLDLINLRLDDPGPLLEALGVRAL